LVTGSLPPHDVCGVGDYTKRLHDELDRILPVELVHLPIRRAYEPALFRVFQGRDIVHLEYPTEGWGKSVLPSLLPLARRVHGPRARLVLTLHEWSQMNRVRRASIRPLIAGTDAFVFVTPFERDAFLKDVPGASRKPSFVIPIGVNLEVPVVPDEEVERFRASQLKDGADLLLSHFGFIHEAKQPEKLLDVLVELRKLGRRPRMLFIGGFQADKRAEREAFEQKIAARGLKDAALLMGFVEDERLAATYMAASDANVSLFSEGLSSRRGSFWYATQHGCALVTTAPRDPSEFERVASYLVPPHVNFVSPDADAGAIALLLIDLPPYRPFRYPRIPVEQWSDIARSHADMYVGLFDSPNA
jgi:glycosyltransferase involved in cell wall biosynthesis